MISVSQKFLELMQSNIRPKIEPTITVKGQDSEGNQVVLTWKPSNIQNMTYKRGIDPVGRTLPYMELTWTEIYYGKLNAKNYPEKYNNIVKYMAVELNFEQSLGFFNTWKDLYSAGYTWKSVLKQFKTWKNVKRSVIKETIKFPTMFLVARPTIQGQTITWTARDLFYFLNQSHAKCFAKDIDYKNPIRLLLLDERSNFVNSSEIFNAINKTQKVADSIDGGLVSKNIVFENSTKNLLMNYGNLRNCFWDFTNNYAELNTFSSLLGKTTPVFKFSNNIMHNPPELTEQSNVSIYSFTQNVIEVDNDGLYSLSPNETVEIQNSQYYRFVYKGWGIQESTGSSLENISKTAVGTVNKTNVFPVNINSLELVINNNKQGEVFAENNPLNPYNKNVKWIQYRLNYLDQYFQSTAYTMVLKSLSNVALEPKDLVEVETNLFNNNKRIVKKGIVIGIELTYNGSLKQKTIVHEVK